MKRTSVLKLKTVTRIVIFAFFATFFAASYTESKISRIKEESNSYLAQKDREIKEMKSPIQPLVNDTNTSISPVPEVETHKSYKKVPESKEVANTYVDKIESAIPDPSRIIDHFSKTYETEQGCIGGGKCVKNVESLPKLETYSSGSTLPLEVIDKATDPLGGIGAGAAILK